MELPILANPHTFGQTFTLFLMTSKSLRCAFYDYFTNYYYSNAIAKEQRPFYFCICKQLFYSLFGLDCTQILLVYYKWIEVSAVNVGMTFKIVPSSANMK